MNIHTNQSLGETKVEPVNKTPEDEVCEIIGMVHVIAMATEHMEDVDGWSINRMAKQINERLKDLEVADHEEQAKPARDVIDVHSAGQDQRNAPIENRQRRTVKSELDQISRELGFLAGFAVQADLRCEDTSTAVHITALDMIERIESIDPEVTEKWTVIEGTKRPSDLSKLRTPTTGTVAYELHKLACAAWMLCVAADYLVERKTSLKIYRPAYDVMQRLMVLCKLGFGQDVPIKKH